MKANTGSRRQMNLLDRRDRSNNAREVAIDLRAIELDIYQSDLTLPELEEKCRKRSILSVRLKNLTQVKTHVYLPTVKMLKVYDRPYQLLVY